MAELLALDHRAGGADDLRLPVDRADLLGGDVGQQRHALPVLGPLGGVERGEVGLVPDLVAGDPALVTGGNGAYPLAPVAQLLGLGGSARRRSSRCPAATNFAAHSGVEPRMYMISPAPDACAVLTAVSRRSQSNSPRCLLHLVPAHAGVPQPHPAEPARELSPGAHRGHVHAEQVRGRLTVHGLRWRFDGLDRLGRQQRRQQGQWSPRGPQHPGGLIIGHRTRAATVSGAVTGKRVRRGHRPRSIPLPAVVGCEGPDTLTVRSTSLIVN